MGIGDKIKDIMMMQNLTQKQLAEKCNLTEAAVSKYINNERTPRVDILINVSKALNVSTDYFMEEKITEFAKLKDLVARNVKNLEPEEKLELMNLLSQSRKKK